MSLTKSLKKYNVSCLHVKPLHVNACIILGNLYGNDEVLDSLDSFYSLSPQEYKNDKMEFFGKYEVGSEEGVLALLLKSCAVKKDDKFDDFIDGLDIGYISAECNISEEEAEELSLHVKGKKTCLIVCKDLEFHQRADNIAKLLSMIEYYCEFEIVYEELDSTIKGDGLVVADEIEELSSFDGAVVYFWGDKESLLGSAQFALSNKIKDKEMVLVKIKDDEFKRKFELQDDLKGTIGLLGGVIKRDSYAYEVSKISRISDE